MRENVTFNHSELKNPIPKSKTISHSENESILGTVSNFRRIIELDSDTFYQEWENYVLQHSESHIYNHPLWFKALEHEYNRKGIILVCLDSQENIKGVLPLLPTIGLPLKLDDFVTTRRYSSLPRTPLSSLLVDDQDAKRMLLQTAVNIVNKRRRTFLQLKSYSDDFGSECEQIKQIVWRSSFVRELPEKQENIKFGDKKNHHKVKWSVNKAKSLGIEVREANTKDDLKNWYNLYLETMRYHVVADRPYRLFDFFWKNFRQKNLMTVLLAEKNADGEKQLLSGSLFFHFNKTFFYSFNGRSQTGLASHANDLLQWEAIHLASRMGYQEYDMGEVSCNNSGLAQFKLKWGCHERPIYHYYYPFNEKMKLNNTDISGGLQLKKIIWRNIPLPITKYWGILTNRFL
jgi:hypothetical protein